MLEGHPSQLSFKKDMEPLVRANAGYQKTWAGVHLVGVRAPGVPALSGNALASLQHQPHVTKVL